MPDIIQLLPESIANQIAAGEVVQRPASVVKELIENSIDANAKNIQVIVKDAGKTLIQINDDGDGMSNIDARMCFERHATSKIRTADDLFHIRTLGFRGEALASIAAVAQVELKSRMEKEEVGTLINVEGSRVHKQEPEACPKGTSITVKNLFFNVPARRNFLKSNSVEMRHIIDEFQHAALSHPEIGFKLYQNDMEVYNLPAGKLVRRIVNIFGRNYQEQLVVCQEDTSHINIKGYIGKPNFAKKTRGEQFIFVNDRFIKNNYLNHAILTAYENLLPQDYYPFYVLFLDIDPEHIDVNVHPTKTEIKFVDERTIYGIIKASVRQALGQHNISPSLDFSQDVNVDLHRHYGGENTEQTTRDLNYERLRSSGRELSNIQNWERMYENIHPEKEFSSKEDTYEDQNFPESVIIQSGASSGGQTRTFEFEQDTSGPVTYQVHGKFILTQVKSGMMMIDQVAAHQRIIYEKYLSVLKNDSGTSQKLLFPVTLELNPSDHSLVMGIREEIISLGFEFEVFGKNAIIINGVPSAVSDINEKEVFEGLIEQFKLNREKLELKTDENLAMSMARYTAIREGKFLNEQERQSMIDQLFGCKNPNYSPFGQSTFYIFTLEHLQEYLKRKN